MPAAGEDHCQSVLVAGVNHLGVVLRAAGLNGGDHSGGCGSVNPESAKGKNASEPNTAPAPRSPAFSMAIRTESTRLICPAPTPKSEHPLASTMALDFTNRTVLQANRRSGPLLVGGLLVCDDLPLAFVIGQNVGSLGAGSRHRVARSSPPRQTPGGEIGPIAISRTLAFHFGRVVSTCRAAGSNSGATIASMNCPGAARISAAARSTGRLKPSTAAKRTSLDRPPGRGSSRFDQRAASLGRAAGVVVLDDRDCGRSEPADDGQGTVEIEQVVVREVLTIELACGKRSVFEPSPHGSPDPLWTANRPAS